MNESNDGNKVSEFCACRLAVSVGLVWGMCCGLLAVITIFTEDYGHRMVEVIGSIYWGYKPASWFAVLAGFVWAFLDGFVGVLIILGVYHLLKRHGCCCCKSK